MYRKEDNMNKLVELLRKNARLTNNELAVMLGKKPEEIEAEIAELENQGLVIGYSAVINEEEVDRNCVTAFIEIKVSPQAENGYNEIATMLAQYKEVDSVYLMSGSFDLSVTIRGTNLREVALFVSDKLAPIDGVLSTTTHFILRRYKEKGIEFPLVEDDERGMVGP
ncbi:MAG: Lrp/AsnC family transcriptional regulator [Ruminiclostridium sp.]|nr:Lrp/AsnC family transcriptional regulator [Ruminiclostridium sp.]